MGLMTRAKLAVNFVLRVEEPQDAPERRWQEGLRRKTETVKMMMRAVMKSMENPTLPSGHP